VVTACRFIRDFLSIRDHEFWKVALKYASETLRTLPMRDSYDSFSRIYNAHWGHCSLQLLGPYNKHLLMSLEPGSRVLDLCCGTGQFARALFDKGFGVTGVDSSAQMLQFAKANAPDVEFIQDDVRYYRSQRKFDAVICVFDSLNHLLTPHGLRAAFQTAYCCTALGGVFGFDMNMEHQYVHNWTNEFVIEDSEAICEVKTSVDISKKRATFVAGIRNRNKIQSPSLTRIVLQQTWHDITTVMCNLQSVGFEEKVLHVISGRSIDEAERILFVCRK